MLLLTFQQQSKYIGLDFHLLGTGMEVVLHQKLMTQIIEQDTAQQRLVNCSVEIAALKFTDVMVEQLLAKQNK